MNKALAPLFDQYAQGRDRYMALQLRERWMLGVGATLVLLTLLYLLIWEPIVTAHTERSMALESARATAIKLEDAAALVQSQRGRNPAATAGRGLSLMAAVDQASKQGSLGKGPARIQPEGDREVRVWFEDVSFDALLRWTAELQARYGVSVQTMDVEPQATPGQVNVRFSLVRAS